MGKNCAECGRRFGALDYSDHAVYHANRAVEYCEIGFWGFIKSWFVGLPSERGRNYDPSILCWDCVRRAEATP